MYKMGLTLIEKIVRKAQKKLSLDKLADLANPYFFYNRDDSNERNYYRIPPKMSTGGADSDSCY